MVRIWLNIIHEALPLNTALGFEFLFGGVKFLAHALGKGEYSHSTVFQGPALCPTLFLKQMMASFFREGVNKPKLTS
jgi:hypothetical protein